MYDQAEPESLIQRSLRACVAGEAFSNPFIRWHTILTQVTGHDHATLEVLGSELWQR